MESKGIELSQLQQDVYLEKASEQAIFDHKSAVEINKRIPVELNREYLIKLLPAEKVTVIKEYPVETGERDPETGAAKYTVESREEEIDNPIVEAIILSTPRHPQDGTVNDYIIGEHILVAAKAAVPFYTYKDSHVVNGFNILGRVKPEMVKSIESESPVTEAEFQEMMDAISEANAEANSAA